MDRLLLQKLMKENNDRPEDLAHKIRYSFHTVMSWIRGKNEPRPRALQQIADLYGVSLRDLQGKEGE